MLLKDQISYKVFLYSADIVRDFQHNRQSEMIPAKFGHNQKYIKFKLGNISIDELRNTNQGGNQDFFLVLLARVNVSKSQSFYVDEDPSLIKDLKLPQNDNHECYYLHQKQNETSK